MCVWEEHFPSRLTSRQVQLIPLYWCPMIYSDLAFIVMESTMELTHIKSINNAVIPTKAAWPVASWKVALIRPCCERWQKSEDWAFSSALWQWFEWKLFASRGILSGIETCCVDPKAAWYSSSSRPYISVGSTLRKSSYLLCKTQRKGEKW